MVSHNLYVCQAHFQSGLIAMTLNKTYTLCVQATVSPSLSSDACSLSYFVILGAGQSTYLKVLCVVFNVSSKLASALPAKSRLYIL